jgi:hypothetical protein
MRAHFGGNLEGDFQFCQRLPNIRRRNGAEHGTAFIADNISLIPANNAVQAAAALRIAKVWMRQGCFDVAFESRPVTDGAIARPGEWSKVTITVSAARIIAVAQRDASTPRRRR